MMSPDDGCRECGTIDSRHADYCPRAPRRPAIGTGPLPKLHEGSVLTKLPSIKKIGDECNVCEGPCRYGNCADCGGHSEHNWGCPQTPTYRPDAHGSTVA